MFKSKKVLMEKIHSMKKKKLNQKSLEDQKEARLGRSRGKKERRDKKLNEADVAKA